MKMVDLRTQLKLQENMEQMEWTVNKSQEDMRLVKRKHRTEITGLKILGGEIKKVTSCLTRRVKAAEDRIGELDHVLHNTSS